MLALVVQEALHDFSSTLGLAAVKIDAPLVLSQLDLYQVDLAKGLSILLDRVTLADHTKAAANIFYTGSKQTDSWEQTALADLFCSMLDAMPGQFWSVNLTSLCKAGSGDFMMDAKGDIKQVVRVFAVFSQFVVTMGYITARCFGSEAVTKEHQLRSELVGALSFARHTAGSLLMKLTDPLFKSEAILSAPLAAGAQTIERWSKIARVLLQRSCFDVLHKVLSSIDVLSLKCRKGHPTTRTHLEFGQVQQAARNQALVAVAEPTSAGGEDKATLPQLGSVAAAPDPVGRGSILGRQREHERCVAGNSREVQCSQNEHNNHCVR